MIYNLTYNRNWFYIKIGNLNFLVQIPTKPNICLYLSQTNGAAVVALTSNSTGAAGV